MSPAAVTLAGMAAAFLFGGGTGLLYWRSAVRKQNAESADAITTAAQKIVLTMQSVVASLEQRIRILEVENEICATDLERLATELRRLGGHPAVVMSQRRKNYRKPLEGK